MLGESGRFISECPCCRQFRDNFCCKKCLDIRKQGSTNETEVVLQQIRTKIEGVESLLPLHLAAIDIMRRKHHQRLRVLALQQDIKRAKEKLTLEKAELEIQRRDLVQMKSKGAQLLAATNVLSSARSNFQNQFTAEVPSPPELKADFSNSKLDWIDDTILQYAQSLKLASSHVQSSLIATQMMVSEQLGLPRLRSNSTAMSAIPGTTTAIAVPLTSPDAPPKMVVYRDMMSQSHYSQVSEQVYTSGDRERASGRGAQDDTRRPRSQTMSSTLGTTSQPMAQSSVMFAYRTVSEIVRGLPLQALLVLKRLLVEAIAIVRQTLLAQSIVFFPIHRMAPSKFLVVNCIVPGHLDLSELPVEAGATILSYIAHGLNLVACYLGMHLPAKMDFGHPISVKKERQLRYPMIHHNAEEIFERSKVVFRNVLYLCDLMKIRGLGLNVAELVAYTAALFTHPKLGRDPREFRAVDAPAATSELHKVPSKSVTSADDDWTVIEVPNVPKTSEPALLATYVESLEMGVQKHSVVPTSAYGMLQPYY